MSTAQTPALDMTKLNAFVGQFVTDLGAAVHTGMVVIGEKLGLYKALLDGPMSSAQLAARTKTDERYLREWLGSQAAGGYVTYNEQTDKFGLTAEQAFTLADEDSPAYLPGAFELALGSLAAVPRIADGVARRLPLFDGLDGLAPRFVECDRALDGRRESIESPAPAQAGERHVV